MLSPVLGLLDDVLPLFVSSIFVSTYVIPYVENLSVLNFIPNLFYVKSASKSSISELCSLIM